MSFDPYPDLFLLLEVVLFFGFAIYAFIRAQRVTKSISYVNLTIGIIINFIGYGFLVSTVFFSDLPKNEGTVLILATLTNIFLGIGFLVLMNGFILIREDKLPIFSHFAALLVGISSMLFGFVDISQLSFNETTLFWEIDYFSGDFKNVFLGVLITILVIFIIYFILYLVRKFQKWQNDKKFDVTFIGFAFLAAWMVTPFFQSSKIFRQYLLPAAILCWGIAVVLDPLNMLASNKLPDEIILVSKNDHPILRFNLAEKSVDKNLEEIRMLITGKNMISDSLNSKDNPKDLTLKNKEIKYIKLAEFYVIAIGTRVDRNSRSAIIKSFKELCKKTDLEYLETALVLKESDEQLFVELLINNFQRIDASKKNNT
ncbi:MAG: hypothetical protein GPJ51_10205 [Candidatus Heimdallarchaeota archaeon]|nr:hypothetical protein [Candidatus Heimdallarchaeota archaeon]